MNPMEKYLFDLTDSQKLSYFLNVSPEGMLLLLSDSEDEHLYFHLFGDSSLAFQVNIEEGGTISNEVLCLFYPNEKVEPEEYTIKGGKLYEFIQNTAKREYAFRK